MKTIDFATVVYWAEKAIEDRGADYVYERPQMHSTRCYNVHKGENGELVAGCIVGKMLTDNEVVSLEWLHMNDAGVGGVIGSMDDFPEYQGKFKFTEPAKHLLANLQSKQDAGNPWGDALHMAVMLTAKNLAWALENS